MAADGGRVRWALERGLVPDALVRRRIRDRLRSWLAGKRAEDAEAALAREERLVAEMRESPAALPLAEARARHRDVPPAFCELVLGAHRSSASGLWAEGVTTLEAAEAAMLALLCERAQLADGQNVLELGCGWGALTLFMAERFPRSRIVAVSSSQDQRARVEAKAAERKLTNVKVVTCDLHVFDPATGPAFDRVLSAEMLEHVRGWPELLGRIASWMKPDGRLFLDVVTHRDLSCPLVPREEADEVSLSLFPGGLMPSDRLLLRFPEHLLVEAQWRLNGTHHARTAEAWLANLDRNRAKVRDLFARTYGPGAARRKVAEWRLFLMASAELGAYRGGNEWMVSHYRLRRRRA